MQRKTSCQPLETDGTVVRDAAMNLSYISMTDIAKVPPDVHNGDISALLTTD